MAVACNRSLCYTKGQAKRPAPTGQALKLD
jgi:hypothetical protein